MSTPVLFCEKNSVYRYLGCDVYDLSRNAISCKSFKPAIYHPPCQSWSRLRKFSNFVPGNHWLGVWAFIRVRRFGGILEQPESSYLFKFMKAPLPGTGYDHFGGRTVVIDQVKYGHKCRKRTWLYIVDFWQNLELNIPCPDNKPVCIIASSSKKSILPAAGKKWRNYTPLLLAKELLSLTSKIEYT
jgi:hypothetical protein